MPLSQGEDLLIRKRTAIGGERINKRKDIRTSPERQFIYRQRDKLRAKTRRVM